MESYGAASQSLVDSHRSRSRASSQVSVGESKFGALNITEEPLELASPSFAAIALPLSSPALRQDSRASPSFLNCPVPRHYATFPLSAPEPIDQHWLYLDRSSTSEAPILRLEQPDEESFVQQPLPSKLEAASDVFDQAAMRWAAWESRRLHPADLFSTLGIQFDSRFDVAVRSSYSWPVFDINEPFMGQELGSLDPYPNPNALPLYARSLSSSPPQAIFSPEQRELKRQRDQARRDSKSKLRRDRSLSNSNSYNPSATATPDILPRTIDGGFSSAMGPMTVMTDASVSLLDTNQNYLSTAPLSTSASPELYGTPFPLVSNEFQDGFLMAYSSATTESLLIPSYSPRPHSMSSASDQPYFYRSSPVSMPQESPDTVRVVHSRPKPQCWDHGCNGRQFSTFSNLLRHQREKSGAASKPTCPKCGAEFTRTTARNGHMAHEKCKQRRNS